MFPFLNQDGETISCSEVTFCTLLNILALVQEGIQKMDAKVILIFHPNWILKHRTFLWFCFRAYREDEGEKYITVDVPILDDIRRMLRLCTADVIFSQRVMQFIQRNR